MFSHYPKIPQLVSNGAGTEILPCLTPEPLSTLPGSPDPRGKLEAYHKLRDQGRQSPHRESQVVFPPSLESPPL